MADGYSRVDGIKIFMDGKSLKTSRTNTNITHRVSETNNETHVADVAFISKPWKGRGRIAVAVGLGKSIWFVGGGFREWCDDFEETSSSSISGVALQSWPRQGRSAQEMFPDSGSPELDESPKQPCWQNLGIDCSVFQATEAAALDIAKRDSLLKDATQAAMFSDWLEEHGIASHAALVRKEFGL